VLGVLNHQLRKMSGVCAGLVLMPNHVHALIWLPDPKLWRRFLHGWKRMSSFRIRKWYKHHAPNYFAKIGMGTRFWNRKSYVFHGYRQRKLLRKLEYMHLNPVTAKLVVRDIDWPWSSARWYESRRSVGVPIQWIEGV
jgi:putative transposase